MAETELMRAIRQCLSRGLCRLFRCNVGTGWAGGDGQRRATVAVPANLADLRRALRPGDVVVPCARPLHAGLQKGNGDLIGWQTVTVPPEWVGRSVAVFVSVEVKAPGRGERRDQANWRRQVLAAGGIAGVARSVDEAMTICNNWQPPPPKE